MTKYSLTGDRVLIKADKPKDVTATGFHILQEWKSLPPTGEIVSMGPGVSLDYELNGAAYTAKIGDKVMFERYGSVILENDLRLCKASHILGVITDDIS